MWCERDVHSERWETYVIPVVAGEPGSVVQRRRVRASIDCSQLLHLPALNVVWQVSEPGFDGFDGFAHTAQQIRHGPVTILIQDPCWPYNHHIHILMKVKSFHKSSQNSWSSPILINCNIVSLCFYAYVSVSLLLKLFRFSETRLLLAYVYA
jgi:hypothetical protein